MDFAFEAVQDDIRGRWRGTIRQFEKYNYISVLNKLASIFGIRFGDQHIGTLVNYLDVTKKPTNTLQVV